jgi:hypothetical protein
VKRAIAGLAVLASLGCGAPAHIAAGAAPSTGASPAATQMPAPPASRLSLTGVVTGTVQGATAAGRCGPATAGGLGAELRFQLQGRPWAVALSLPTYRTPGTYPLPPGRVSLHTLGIGPAAQFFGSQAGSVKVAADGLSGSIEADLAGDDGTVHVSGAWSCLG